MSPAKSSKQPVASRSHIFDFGMLEWGIVEWGILLAIWLLTLMMVRSAGWRRGFEMMPWPDGLEYAASAVNLANGRGAVLHFGGYTYPSRYTGGYPLILASVYHGAISQGPSLFLSTPFGMISGFLLFGLAVRSLGRAAGSIAALLLALSPVFITYSSL